MNPHKRPLLELNISSRHNKKSYFLILFYYKYFPNYRIPNFYQS